MRGLGRTAVFLLCLAALAPGAPPDDHPSACMRRKVPLRSEAYRITGYETLDAFLAAEKEELWLAFGVRPYLMLLQTGDDADVFAALSRTRTRLPGTVAYGLPLLRDRLWRWGGAREAAVAAFLAHGHAHIAQFTCKGRLAGRERELHADALAGWYVGRRAFAGVREAGEVEAFATRLFGYGHAEFRDEEAHGRLEERVAAFTAGWDLRDSVLADVFRPLEVRISPEPEPAPAPAEEPGEEPGGGEAEMGAPEPPVAPPPAAEPPARDPLPGFRIVRRPCVHRVACTHKGPCVHAIPCRHEISCTHRVECVHIVPCAHRVQCTHRAPCRHFVPCGHRQHPYDLEHACDIDAQGRRVPCTHVCPCAHPVHQADAVHESDPAHEYDTLHEFDRLHNWDPAHACDHRHDCDYLHNWDPMHEWDFAHEWDEELVLDDG